MSEDDQITAIGYAVRAATESKRELLALEAMLERAAENFRVAHQALREILTGGEVGQGRDVYKALKAIPDVQKIKELLREFGEVRSRHAELAERARKLSGF
jgi:hypothetical protein